jgi:hypothetical protein
VPSEVNVAIMDDLLRWKWSPGSLSPNERARIADWLVLSI